jgi:hypothetical protein
MMRSPQGIRRLYSVCSLFLLGLAAAPAPGAGLSAENAPITASRASSPPLTLGGKTLALDDGSYENALGSLLGGQFIWLNRIPVPPADLPLFLDEVQILFPSGNGVNSGETVDIYVYTDPDGDGNPATGMALMATINRAKIQAVDGVTWSRFALASPLRVEAATELVVAVVNRTAGAGLGERPAALDQSSSQGRSWVGIDASGTIGAPPVLPTDAIWGTVDSLGFPGNWMIRVAIRHLLEPPTPVPVLTPFGVTLLPSLLGAIAFFWLGGRRNPRDG